MYLGTLSGKSEYNAVSAVKGSKYKIWFSLPPQDPRVWTTMWRNKKTPRIYMERWNNGQGQRFLITKEPVVNAAGDTIYLEGTAKTNELFGILAMDAAWARMNPWYVGGGAWRGIEKVNYSSIVGPSGKDILSPGEFTQEPGGSPGGSPVGSPDGGLPAGEEGTATSYFTPILIGAGLLTATLITVALVAKKKRRKVA